LYVMYDMGQEIDATTKQQQVKGPSIISQLLSAGVVTWLQNIGMRPGIDLSHGGVRVPLRFKNPGIGTTMPQNAIGAGLIFQGTTALFQRPAKGAAQS